MSSTRIVILIAAGIAAVLGIAAALVVARGDGDTADRASGTPCRDSVSTTVPQATGAQLAAAGLARLPLAPDGARVDLVAPPFSNPTEVSNPLFPISKLRSAILNGTVEGKPFRTETTLLPDTRIMEWSDGQCVEVLVSQYLAYLDGRIEEVALDHYAQADDGSVWYLGEDVFNYEDGVIADTEGTWFAGIDGPAAMIMPRDPKVGDTYRAENIVGLVFEEVTVKAVDKTVAGPHGAVRGAITVRELHDDGTFEEKLFAPGYGEFFTAGGGDVEALTVAVPTDSLPGGVPAALDLKLQYLPTAEIDLGRFDVRLRRLLVDAGARDQSAVVGDVATLEWIRDRIEKALDPVDLTRLDTLLKELRTNAGDEDFRAASETALQLRELVA
jgi:hypothetical protein